MMFIKNLIPLLDSQIVNQSRLARFVLLGVMRGKARMGLSIHALVFKQLRSIGYILLLIAILLPSFTALSFVSGAIIFFVFLWIFSVLFSPSFSLSHNAKMIEIIFVAPITQAETVMRLNLSALFASDDASILNIFNVAGITQAARSYLHRAIAVLTGAYGFMARHFAPINGASHPHCAIAEVAPLQMACV